MKIYKYKGFLITVMFFNGEKYVKVKDRISCEILFEAMTIKEAKTIITKIVNREY